MDSNMVYIASLLLIFLSTVSAEQSLLRGGAASTTRQLNADAYIFKESSSDGYAQGTGSKAGNACNTHAIVTFVDDGDQDYMNVATTKWRSGGYRMGCLEKDSNWNCIAECNFHPNFRDWTYITFQVRASRMTDICRPAISLGKKWPMYASQNVELSGSIVDGGGSLNELQWKRVVLPTELFATAEWPNVDGVKDIYFRNGGDCGIHYQVRDMFLTDTPPSIENETATSSPTATPTSSSQWVWNDTSHGYAIENQSYTCFEQYERTKITIVDNEGDFDYFTVSPDKWVSGGLRFGCVHKDSSYNCDTSCFPFDKTSPDWSSKRYLTFMAKVDGDLSATCKPSLSLTGGGWPRHSSNKIVLEENYVDAGYLTSNEWRRVLIPLHDFKTNEWNLNSVYGMYFQTCGTDHSGLQPTYSVASIAITNVAIELKTTYPSFSPTQYVTDNPLLATHRFVHKNWYPLLSPEREPKGHSWISTQDNTWPMVNDADPYTVTIHIPENQSIVFSGNDATKYDKIIVEGSLVIKPEYAHVKLTVGTIVVEEGGVLDIKTEGSAFTVTIEIDGALDTTKDPEEQMVGIIALEGSLTIIGNDVPTKVATLERTVLAESNLIDLRGYGFNFNVGEELVLPDTQTGLDVGHWNFPNNANYVDQTEICVISALHESDGNTNVVCLDTLKYNHTSESHVGHITRSINIMTSPYSTDRGHLLHTGRGRFEVRNTRVENFGRTTTDMIDSTEMYQSDLKFGEGKSQMIVTKLGTNQIARYAIHAHHSLVEAYFTGNAALYSPRDGMVAHNSRVHILNNVVVGADGTGIFLEDSTETGPVIGNYIVGTGGGTRGGDDGRFSSQKGLDMAHGGFGIWCRGKLALIQDNHCEGHFGFAPYAFFVHPNFISDKRVPNVQGTPQSLIGKTNHEISNMLGDQGLELQSFGGFVNNTATATFQVGLDMSYFGTSSGSDGGSIIEGLSITSLASSGRGMSTTHSTVFTLNNVTIEGTVEDNSITGIWCNNCNGCTLRTPNTTLVVDNVEVIRGGNC